MQQKLCRWPITSISFNKVMKNSLLVGIWLSIIFLLMKYTIIIYSFQILFCKNSVPYSITFTRCLGSSSTGYQCSRLGRTIPLSGWARRLSRAWWVNEKGHAMIFRCQNLVSKLHTSRLQNFSMKFSALNEYFEVSFPLEYCVCTAPKFNNLINCKSKFILLIINNLNYILDPNFCPQI